MQMNDFGVNVRLELATVPKTYDVRVSPRQLFYLDMCTHRMIDRDGTVRYIVTPTAAERLSRHAARRAQRRFVA
jgi:hypothetical protein